MTKKRPHIERISSTDYEALYPARLTQADLVERRPLSLLVRSAGEEYQAYRLSINAESIVRGMAHTAFSTVLLDQDFHPATRGIFSIVDHNNDWFSSTFALVDNGVTITTRHGFLAPPKPDEYDNILTHLQSINLRESVSS